MVLKQTKDLLNVLAHDFTTKDLLTLLKINSNKCVYKAVYYCTYKVLLKNCCKYCSN